MAKLDFSSMASLFKKPLSEVEQIAGLIKQYNPLSRNNQAQLGMDSVLSRGANINGDQVDFKSQNEELIEKQQMQAPQQSMGGRVLESFKKYAGSDIGKSQLMNLGALAIASTQKDPYIKTSMAQGIQQQIAQRPILEQQRLERERAAEDRERQIKKDKLDEILKEIQIAQLRDKPETEKQKTQDKKGESYSNFIRDQKAKGVSLIKKGERLNQIPDQFKQEFTNPETGKKEAFIDRKGLSKRKEETDKTIAYRKNIINKNNRLLKNVLGKLITTDKEGNTVFTKVGSEMTTNPFLKKFDRAFSEEFRDMEGLLKTLKANLGFDQLQAMRDASPTGGALGQVSEKELDFLQSAAGALDIGMSKENLINSLAEIKKSLERLNKEQNLDYDSVFMGTKITNTNPLGI